MSETDRDRIRLAEAMGWKWFDPYWTSTGEPPEVTADVCKYLYSNWPAETPPVPPFDPFTDANDDYAVLEWARVQPDSQFRVFQSYFAKQNQQLAWRYQIGDYARAALKVLSSTESVDSEDSG